MAANVPPSVRFVSTYILRNAEGIKNPQNQKKYRGEAPQSYANKDPAEIELPRGNLPQPVQNPLLNYPDFYREEYQERQHLSSSVKAAEHYNVPGSTSIVLSQPPKTAANSSPFSRDAVFESGVVDSTTPVFPATREDEDSQNQNITTSASRQPAEQLDNVEKRLMEDIAQFEFLAEYIRNELKGIFKNGLLETCFVIFVNFWCRCLAHNSKLGKSFLLSHQGLFLPEKKKEIMEMRIVPNHTQLKIFRHLKPWIKKKIHISISRLSYRLLFHFLSEPDHSALLYCVVQHVIFDIRQDSDVVATVLPYHNKTRLNEPPKSIDYLDINNINEPETGSTSPLDAVDNTYKIDIHYNKKTQDAVPWGLLSGLFNKVECLEPNTRIPWYLQHEKEALALINGEITKPVDPNFALPLCSESDWAIDAWHNYNVERTSRRIHLEPSNAFPSVLSFNLDCITNELTVVKLSQWSSSPWLVAARQSGVIGLWDIPKFLESSNDAITSKQEERDDNKNQVSDSNNTPSQPKERDLPLPQLLISHGRSVTALAFVPPTISANSASHDSLRERHCLSASTDGSMRLWSLQRASAVAAYNGKEKHESSHHFAATVFLSSPSSFMVWSLKELRRNLCRNFFVTGGADSLSCLFSFSRDYPLRIFTGHLSDVQVVKCSPNSVLLATGSMDASIKLWDIRSAKALQTLNYRPSAIKDLAFSPNGRLICSATDEEFSSLLVLWDIALPKPLAIIHLPQQVGFTTSLAFSFGSHTLVVGCSAGVVLVISINDIATQGQPDSQPPHHLQYEIAPAGANCEVSSPLRLIPLGQRFPAHIVFTPENIAALCSIPMTNTHWIPAL